MSDWSRGVLKSWNNDSAEHTIENAPAGGRYCEVKGFGKFDEKIIHFDENKFEISWSATGEKFPKFVSGLQNEVKVEIIDENNCKIVSNLSADLSGVMGMLTGSFLKKNFAKQISGFLNDWKTFTETGEISASKKREIAKLSQ